MAYDERVRAAAFGGWVLFAAATASAQPAGRLTAYVAGAPGAALPALRAGVGDTYAGDGRIEYRPIGELMPEATEDPAAELKKADDDLEEGDKAFSGMDIDPAKTRLHAAIDRYKVWLPELVQRDHGAGKLLTAWLLLSKVYFFDGDMANARLALRHALTLDPTLRFNAAFPPQMKKIVSEARAEYDQAGLGHVAVTPTPAGAIVYVDGMARPSPGAQTIALPSGPHDFRFDMVGHERAVESIDVAGAGAPPAELKVALAETASSADGLFAPIVARLDEGGAAPPELSRAAQKLGVDLIALVRASAAAGGKVALRGWLYDVRRDLVLKRATREAGGSDEELRLGGRYFARELTTGVRLDGKPEPPPHKATFAEKWRGFADSKWFWPVVGTVGGLVVTGAAVGVGVGVARSRAADEGAASAVVLTGGR